MTVWFVGFVCYHEFKTGHGVSENGYVSVLTRKAREAPTHSNAPRRKTYSAPHWTAYVS
jgi:hypothetical protein